MPMKQLDHEPACLNEKPHSWFLLGTADNGEKVSRCPNCMAHRFEKVDGKLRYEVPADAG